MKQGKTEEILALSLITERYPETASLIKNFCVKTISTQAESHH